MVSRDDVVAAYRLILGREPESDQVVYEHMKASGLHELRSDFINSVEFQNALPDISVPPSAVIDSAPVPHIEVHVPAELLERLFDKVARCWTRLGQTEPYWSVLSQDRFRQENFTQNRAAFYASGEHDVNRLIAWLERNGLDWSRFGSCMELGCGTGRVTPWLARKFPHVLAIDVSPVHLQLAAARAREEKLQNIEFLHMRRIDVLDTIPRVDLVFSLIVLQHNPPPVIYSILGRIFRRLNPGGVALFQVPTYGPGYSFETQRYLFSPEGPDFDMHIIPQRFVFESVECNNCAVLEVQPDGYAGAPRWTSNTFLIKRRSK